MRKRNPLESLLYKTGQQEELSEAEDRLFAPGFKKKFVDLYDRVRPDPEDFTDVYGAERIERDVSYTKKRKAGFEQQTTSERSRLAERLTYYLISEKKLLGEGIDALPSSEYDDIAHGVDLILETENTDLLPRKKDPEDNLYWLGIDITASEDKWRLRDKRNKVDANIREGRLTTLSYFQSEPAFKGEAKVPTIVLQIKHENLRQMALLLTAKNFDATLFQQIQEKIKRDLIDALEEAIEIARENVSQSANEETKMGHSKMLKAYRTFKEVLSRSAQTPERLVHK